VAREYTEGEEAGVINDALQLFPKLFPEQPFTPQGQAAKGASAAHAAGGNTARWATHTSSDSMAK